MDNGAINFILEVYTVKKEKLSKAEKAAVAAFDHQEKLVQQAINSFYPDGILADFSFSSENAPFAELLASEQDTFSQEQMVEECKRIRSAVQAKKPNNIEVRFNEGAHYFDGVKHPLATTIAKFRAMDGKPTYLYVKDRDTVDAIAFIGGDNVLAFLATKGKDGKEQIIRLSEFHLLSYHEASDPKKEVGLLTSFVWPGVKIYSSVLFAWNLFPVKNLLLSEWLQSEWKRIKDAAGQPANQIEGGAEHEQKA